MTLISPTKSNSRRIQSKSLSFSFFSFSNLCARLSLSSAAGLRTGLESTKVFAVFACFVEATKRSDFASSASFFVLVHS